MMRDQKNPNKSNIGCTSLNRTMLRQRPTVMRLDELRTCATRTHARPTEVNGCKSNRSVDKVFRSVNLAVELILTNRKGDGEFHSASAPIHQSIAPRRHTRSIAGIHQWLQGSSAAEQARKNNRLGASCKVKKSRKFIWGRP